MYPPQVLGHLPAQLYQLACCKYPANREFGLDWIDRLYYVHTDSRFTLYLQLSVPPALAPLAATMEINL